MDRFPFEPIAPSLAQGEPPASDGNGAPAVVEEKPESLSHHRGMKRLSYVSWLYRGYIVRRNGRGTFLVERIPGLRSCCFTDEFPTLWRARSFVDWLAESKG